MSALKIKIIDNSAELCSFCGEEPDKLVLSFDSPHEGYLKIGSTSFPLSGTRLVVKLSALNDGLLFPKLILQSKTIPLPILKKRGCDIIPIYPSADQFHALAEKERELRCRVCELEKTVEELSKKVLGEPILEFPSDEWFASHRKPLSGSITDEN